MLVVARTDSRLASNVHDGFAEAMWRCEAYQDMGADVVYFEGPDGVKEMETFNRRVRETPTILAQVEKPGREILDATTCAELGYDAVLFGLTLLSASAAAMERTLLALGAGGGIPRRRARTRRCSRSTSFTTPWDSTDTTPRRNDTIRVDSRTGSERGEVTARELGGMRLQWSTVARERLRRDGLFSPVARVTTAAGRARSSPARPPCSCG